MRLKNFWLEYGEKVPGYDVTVINEREARAAAGILFGLGMIVIFVAIGFNHTMVARIYLGVLFLDFSIRLITPKYSPSLLLGKYAVRNQKPEYVGGVQKRFAWAMGWFIAIPMVYWFVLQWDISFYKVLICVLCLSLMFLEAAFGICVGCMIHKLMIKEDPQHCAGGSCEIRVREPIQMFNPLQKFIAVITVIGLLIGIYAFLVKTESKTFFGSFLHDFVMTEAQLEKEKALEFERETAAEFGDDDDDDDW